ncbi:MAG TPA: copper resistance CopC family protein, partial [Aggregatilineales bacterium]|nr:copper resistance CopC family protein [Aggregatilineales bacterium]
MSRRNPGNRRRLAIMAALAVIISALAADLTPANAHANLVRSEPPANAVLDIAPTQVRLWFSEVPEPAFSKVQLYDRLGTEIGGVGVLKVDGSDSKLLSATLPPLPKGVYTIVWRATSQVDGHVTSGGFAFVYGRDQIPPGGLTLTAPGSLPAASGPTLP